MPNEKNIQFVPGRQYMIRRHADSRRVRVEVTKIMSWNDLKTIAVFGRYVKRAHGQSRPCIVVGDERSWSTEPEFIEEVEQI